MIVLFGVILAAVATIGIAGLLLAVSRSGARTPPTPTSRGGHTPKTTTDPHTTRTPRGAAPGGRHRRHPSARVFEAA